MLLSLILILALIPPPAAPAEGASASPAPTAPARPVPKTIVTVKSSPYCSALEEHFNGALVPMLANDRVFDSVDVQLDAMNDMFKYPDYQNRFFDLRRDLLKETAVVNNSLHPIRDEIDALRGAAKATTDAPSAKEMSEAASQLQDAYNHQFQLATDLTSLAQNMMRYDITRGPHPLGGWTPADNTLPEDEKNVKSWLHFDRQRQSIGMSENQAADTATTAAQAHCAAQ